MTHSPARLIKTLESETGEFIPRAIGHLKRMESEGCIGMSLGTFMPGEEPRSWDAWAKGFVDLCDWLSARTPEQIAAGARAGEDFLKLDSALCQRDWALNIIAELVLGDDSKINEVRETFKRHPDAMRYFENSLKITAAVKGRP